MSELSSLVYVSTAAHEPSHADLTALMSRAQVRNMEHQMSGVLLYSDGTFMQYLEGPPAGLDVVYGFIKADPLHYGIVELVREKIAARQFGQWSMSFRSTNLAGRFPPNADDDLLTHKLTEHAHASDAANILLAKFWNKGLGPNSRIAA